MSRLQPYGVDRSHRIAGRSFVCQKRSLSCRHRQRHAITGRALKWSYSEQHRTGDHIWWISGCSRFIQHYPA